MARSGGIFTRPGRTDQGVDYAGSGPIPALDRAVVTGVGSTTGDNQGLLDKYVIYRLLAGPFKGQHVYVAENFQPTVKVGQHLNAGQSVGVAAGTYPYIEVGFNKSATAWDPVGPNNGTATQAGTAIRRYIPQSAGFAVSNGGRTSVGPSQNEVNKVLNEVLSGKITKQQGEKILGGPITSSPLGGFPGGGAIQNAVQPFKSAADALSFIFSIRGLEVIGGGLIMLMGLYLLAKQVGLEPPIPVPAPVAGELARAAK